MVALVLLAGTGACSFAELRRKDTAKPQHCPWGHVSADAIAASVLAVGGTALVATAEPGVDWLGFPNDMLQKTIGVSMLVTAVISIGSAKYGYDIASDCDATNEQLVRDATRRASMLAQRERAWSITRDAAAAARSGNCNKVFELRAQVRVVDTEFHDTIFQADAAILRCLAMVSTAPGAATR